MKQLVLKNVSTAALKIRYKQPVSKAFSMDFPEPFKLRPGMSHPLKVCCGARGAAGHAGCLVEADRPAQQFPL